MSREVEEFFLQYEKMTAGSVTSGIGDVYADTFLFAGIHGVQAVAREDFLKVVPRMKAHFSSLGLSDPQLGTVQVTPIDSRYLLAKVTWKMTIRSSSDDRPITPSATYLLMRGPNHALSIIVQIDHQDLATAVRDQTTEREHPQG